MPLLVCIPAASSTSVYTLPLTCEPLLTYSSPASSIASRRARPAVSLSPLILSLAANQLSFKRDLVATPISSSAIDCLTASLKSSSAPGLVTDHAAGDCPGKLLLVGAAKSLTVSTKLPVTSSIFHDLNAV